MQAAAGRARRLLTSPAASGILSAPRPGCAALAGRGALLPRLDGVPSSPSPSPAPPLLARSFSATSSSRLPREFSRTLIRAFRYLLVVISMRCFLPGLSGSAFRRTGGGRAGEWRSSCMVDGSKVAFELYGLEGWFVLLILFLL